MEKEEIEGQVLNKFYEVHGHDLGIQGTQTLETWKQFCAELTEWWFDASNNKRRRVGVDSGPEDRR